MSNSISFVISSKIALHTAMPYIFELKKRNIAIEYVCSSDNFNEIAKLIKDNDSIILINTIQNKHNILKKVHQIILLIITPINFSSIYQRMLNQRLEKRIKVLLLFLKLVPKARNKNINLYLRSIFSPFQKNTIKAEKIIVITISTIPYIFCDIKKKIYSILESWDHPGKSPIGYQSEKVFLWNQYLKSDWKYFQLDDNIYYSYPIKLKYAIQSNIDLLPHYILYPAISSSDSEKTLYENEVRFLHILCEVTNNLSLKLFIKPKPNTKIGDLDQFLKYSNVMMGEYQYNEGQSSYSLSDEYNQLRLKEMSKASMIINLGTTFAFDACAVGLPVLQLKFTKVKAFSTFSNFETFPHLNNHLFNKKEVIFVLTDNDNIENQLTKIFQDPNTKKKAEQFRDYLRDWLIPKESMEVSVSRVIDEILKDE